MKRIIQIALVATLFLGLSTAVSAQKVGYVNSIGLLQEMPEYKQAQANLTALREQIEKKGNQMVQDLQTKAIDLGNKEQKGEIAPMQLQQEYQKLQEEEASIQKFQQDKQTELANKSNELLEPISKKLNDAITAVAKEGGFKMIFDIQALVYYEPSEDITDQVKAKLGM